MSRKISAFVRVVGNWNAIKKKKASLNNEEAEKMIKSIKEFRKDFDFRQY